MLDHNRKNLVAKGKINKYILPSVFQKHSANNVFAECPVVGTRQRWPPAKIKNKNKKPLPSVRELALGKELKNNNKKIFAECGIACTRQSGRGSAEKMGARLKKWARG